MIYVISDIHGCYEKYQKLLEQIAFSDEDELYVLGDVVDRGPEPMKVLQDMMLRPNVYPILGNHDYMALKVLRKMNVEIQEDNAESHLTEKDLLDYMYWTQDGGDTTAKDFRRLSREEKMDVLDYLEEFSIYEDLEVNGKRYVLAHADIHEFEEDKELDEYHFTDFILYRADYDRRYFKDENTFLVTGHTPTFMIREDQMPFVYQEHGHIAIDCGCVYGQRLAAYCLDDGRITYVE